MKILNTLQEDYHIHSINFSDGFNTIDEIVQFAGKIGLKKIVITDHSQADLDIEGISHRCYRTTLKKRKNEYNDVDVSFGIEWDLLDEEGNCCFDIQGETADFLILSCHRQAYTGDKNRLTEAYINAIKKYKDRIKCLGHLCKKGIAEYLDIERIVKTANEFHIPIEFNCGYFLMGMTDLKQLHIMLSLVDELYVNSDGHTLTDLKKRSLAFDYLKEKWFIK